MNVGYSMKQRQGDISNFLTKKKMSEGNQAEFSQAANNKIDGNL